MADGIPLLLLHDFLNVLLVKVCEFMPAFVELIDALTFLLLKLGRLLLYSLTLSSQLVNLSILEELLPLVFLVRSVYSTENLFVNLTKLALNAVLFEILKYTLKFRLSDEANRGHL